AWARRCIRLLAFACRWAVQEPSSWRLRWPARAHRSAIAVSGRDERQHRVDHPLIPGAAAKVPGERVSDLGLRWRRVVAECRRERHEDAARAEAALHAVVPDELGLERVEMRRIRREALHGLDTGAIGLNCQEQAASYGHAVQQHGARAAD